MFCRTCRERWPGHTACPDCGAPLIDLRRLVGQSRIERLPQFEDLAHQFELGRQERLAEPGVSWRDPEDDAP